MDKKYLGKSVNLPIETHKLVEEYRKHLEEKVGFKVSLPNAIAHAVKKAKDHV